MSLSLPRRRATVLSGVAVAGLVGAAMSAVPAAAAPAPFISEIHYDNAGADAGERVEVQATLGTDLTGWRLVGYNGSNGATYDSRELSGTVTEPAGDPSGDGVVVVDFAGLQNGAPDGLALVDDTGAVRQFISYEGRLTATDGPAAGATSTDIGVAQTGSEPAGASLQRIGDTWVASDVNTFGEVNATGGAGGEEPEPDPEPAPELCGTATPIAVGDVQGSGAETPLAGEQVTLAGTVTSDTPGLDGFTIQDAGDGDDSTSDGIFVYSPGVEVSLGDEVVVQGQAQEYFEQTQVSAGSSVDVCSSGNPLPAATVLPMPSGDEVREQRESMLVEFDTDLFVTGAYNIERYGEVRLSSGGVLVTPTEAAAPGEAAAAVEAENVRREIVLDDASSSSPDTVPYLTVDDSVRIGDVAELGDVVLGYGFDAWRLQPVTGETDQVTFTPGTPRSETAEDVGGDVQVGSYNVLNYFVTLTSEDSDARGASTAAELELQQAKIVSGILGLGADVVALQEIEYGVPFGKDADVAVSALTAALNAADDTGEWDYVPTPDYVRESPDVIQNAIVYRSDVVERVGESLTGATADPDAWSNAREPVVQTFAAPDGDTFTVVGNHFKSKSGSGATGANADTGDGQGAYNADRVRQADALAAFVDSLVASTGEEDVLLMGDFNSYGEEDPIRLLEEAGYVDVVEGETNYTYTFDQRNGNLDHALLSSAAAGKLTGVTIWQVNATEPYPYQYSSDFPELHADYPFRASDHNPVVVGIDTEPAEEPLGTDVSLGDLLQEDTSGPDRDSADRDLLLAAVQKVLAADPGSPVAVLTDPTAELSAFLPDDAAFRRGIEALVPGRVPNEQAAANRLRNNLSADDVEAILLQHVVLGEPLDAATLEQSDGEVLDTAGGGTLTVDVRADGTVVLLDGASRPSGARVVPGATDLNLGQSQVGHTIDRLLVPND